MIANDNEPYLGEGGKLVEWDETALGQRKYNRGRRQRQQGFSMTPMVTIDKFSSPSEAREKM